MADMADIIRMLNTPKGGSAYSYENPEPPAWAASSPPPIYFSNLSQGGGGNLWNKFLQSTYNATPVSTMGIAPPTFENNSKSGQALPAANPPSSSPIPSTPSSNVYPWWNYSSKQANADTAIANMVSQQSQPSTPPQPVALPEKPEGSAGYIEVNGKKYYLPAPTNTDNTPMFNIPAMGVPAPQSNYEWVHIPGVGLQSDRFVKLERPNTENNTAIPNALDQINTQMQGLYGSLLGRLDELMKRASEPMTRKRRALLNQEMGNILSALTTVQSNMVNIPRTAIDLGRLGLEGQRVGLEGQRLGIDYGRLGIEGQNALTNYLNMRSQEQLRNVEAGRQAAETKEIEKRTAALPGSPEEAMSLKKATERNPVIENILNENKALQQAIVKVASDPTMPIEIKKPIMDALQSRYNYNNQQLYQLYNATSGTPPKEDEVRYLGNTPFIYKNGRWNQIVPNTGGQ